MCTQYDHTHSSEVSVCVKVLFHCTQDFPRAGILILLIISFMEALGCC